jgi:DNA adenine methylase
MSQIIPFFGTMESIKKYIEPFCGALGASLNANLPDGVEIKLSDANRDIVELYEEIIRDPRDVEDLVNQFPRDEASYYEIRAWDRDPLWPGNKSKLERAARTLYLNKNGFNGLYRTNRHGYFTTPWCRNPSTNLIDVTGHEEFIDFLQNKVHVSISDWRIPVDAAGAGDLIYCDPPYVDLKDPKKDFSGYLGAFGWSDQVELERKLREAYNRGAKVVISNSWCDATLELYKEWNIESISAPRYLSAKVSSRGDIKELCAWLHPTKTATHST